MDVIKEGMLASAKAAEAAARLGESLFGGKLKFNSQICTTKFQSVHLLELGLKKETADMKWLGCSDENGDIYYMLSDVPHHFRSTDIPAWSLHRLLELQLNSTDTRFEIRFNQLDLKDAYDFSVGHIEWLIKEGYFNKEYLDVD